MNLPLLKRNPDVWRAQQASKREAPIHSVDDQVKSVLYKPPEQPPTGAPPNIPSKRRRKEGREGNDIDKLFDSALGKKQKRSALPPTQQEREAFTNPDITGLESILNAIKGAPKGDKDRKSKRKKVG